MRIYVAAPAPYRAIEVKQQNGVDWVDEYFTVQLKLRRHFGRFMFCVRFSVRLLKV